MDKKRLVDWVKKDEVILATIVLLGIVFYNLIIYHSLYIACPDGDLYLSITKNFLTTGHFIQNSRPSEINLIVPPGLSVIYTILYILFQSRNGILFVQYIIYATSLIVLKRIVYHYTNNTIISYVGSLCFFFNPFILENYNPAYLLTEAWFVPLLMVWLYLFLAKKMTLNNSIIMLSIAMVIMLIRPAFFLLQIFSTCVTCKMSFISKNYKSIISVWSIFGLIIILNILINYRETSSFVVLNNYSGQTIYIANNPNSKNIPYSSGLIDEVVETDFWHSIEDDQSLSRGEKDLFYKTRGNDYIKSHFLLCLKNSMIRFKMGFINIYYLDFYIMLLSILAVKGEERKKLITIISIFVVNGLIASYGYLVYRYSVYMIPLYVLCKMIFVYTIVCWICKWINIKRKGGVM